MCTAATYQTKNFYFGRTMDLEYDLTDDITITPRHYPFHFHHMDTMHCHYAIIGMALVKNDYPLYYDAVNEKGLGLAALRFEGGSMYQEFTPGKDNIAQYELFPWLLGQCSTVKEARVLLEKVNFITTPFQEDMPLSPLHWMLSDRSESIVIEPFGNTAKVYENPAGILTNNPAFETQVLQLSNYMGLSPKPPQNFFSSKLPLKTCSLGMGAIGLPGDLSSQSRFVRATFVKMNSVCGESEADSVSQFFHILGCVNQQRGCNSLGDGKYQTTVYTSCCNGDKGIYYYTTYNNHQITAVNMYNENLDSALLVRFPAICEEQIKMQN